MPEINDIYRAVVKGRLLETVETRNMFTYILTSANATEIQVAQGIEGHLEGMFDDLAANLCTAWYAYEIETSKWYPAVGQTPGYFLSYHSDAYSVAGGEPSDLSSFQAAALCVLKTGVKKTVGRKFLAGIGEARTLEGSISGALIGGLTTFVAGMLASVVFGSGGVAEPGVLDKNGIFHKFTSGTVSSILSSMRRRKPGYGI